MSKTQAQAVLLSMACAIIAASDTLDNIEDADLPLDDPCEDSEVLEVVAAVMIHKALEIKGDGTLSCPAYNQTSPSTRHTLSHTLSTSCTSPTPPKSPPQVPSCTSILHPPHTSTTIYLPKRPSPTCCDTPTATRPVSAPTRSSRMS
ncbi:uncharacterized protein C8R40DRAFT_1167134 [Lentinula edodes]|uniref:uncharacterized protein n=1 Tax=Lentinula edodes TaxID=5353 RepID=UPI001E8ED83C|nr:uncharacterized protein C8R40DRAFT_1167134 [Lentinula edodes]KAH7878394.1 hypothetical protein C8R40DRAFT_1167134 [Lentinula edodes]